MDLSDRMKEHEGKYRSKLIFERPDDALVVRVDGKAFHTYTKGAQVPFDSNLQSAMDSVAIDLCEGIQASVIAYVQSDEVSVIARPYRKDSSAPWFDGNVVKICSVTSAMAAVRMTIASPAVFGTAKPALFDSRAFVLPRDEVVNYLIWRQSDALRNSVQMLARSRFSHKKLTGLSCNEMKEMLRGVGDPWEARSSGSRQGRVIVKVWKDQVVTYVDKRTGITNSTPSRRSEWIVDREAPLFVEDRSYVESRFDDPTESPNVSS